MKYILLLFLCVGGALAQDNGDYDDYVLESKKKPAEEVDPRGHRPKGRETYSPGPAAPPPIGGLSRYRGRPTVAPVGKAAQEKEEYQDAGGCNHMSEAMGVMCPTGCELKKTLIKQERNVRPAVDQLKRSVDDLYQSTNSVHGYVMDMTSEVTQRQRVTQGNGMLVSQYTDSLENQHSFIKDAVDVTFPQNIKILQAVLDKIREKIQRLEKAINVQKTNCATPCKVSCPIPVVSGKECEDIFRKGGEESQMYLIQPDPLAMPYKVFCDQTSQNGGWVVIQNRMDGSVDFGRRWDDYRKGFGNIAFDVGKGHCQTPGEYWLGNNRISHLTKMDPTELLIEMEDWSGSKVYAQYKQFTIQGEANNYLLSIGRYSGTAGNTFLEGATELLGENRTMTIHNGMMFSTYDRDNDKWIPGDPTKQCSREDGGGWWYNRCHSCNPNGRYYWGGTYTKNMAKHGTDDGIVWMNWKGSWYSLKSISMKIRPFFS
ncbi:fibrinogen beta chain [Myxocyprinus asiaticus]|uniref:fibrinogen beta chain n=1 Tax=Myxocyprinus asiaticus TaxID=70543 RepID=UPI0022221DB6|nr:fibrinogen beta chain [Myxocyprinus asiaticus]